MDVRDPAHLRPGLCRTDRRRDAVRRLDVGNAESVFRLRNGLVEQEIGATVDEDRQQAQLFGHGPERRRIAARDDTGEEVDLALELHAPKLFDVGIGSGGLVGGDGLDLALSQQTALGVDLLGRQEVPLQRWLTEHRGRTGQKGHVPGLVGGIRNLAFGWLGSGFHQLRSGNEAGTGKAGPADGDTERAEKLASIDCGGFVHGLLREARLTDGRRTDVASATPLATILTRASISRAAYPKRRIAARGRGVWACRCPFRIGASANPGTVPVTPRTARPQPVASVHA